MRHATYLLAHKLWCQMSDIVTDYMSGLVTNL